MRKPLTAIYTNVALGSATPAISGASSVPEYKPGDVLLCDSGLYVYGQANGAVAEGYICKFVEGTFDFDVFDTTDSGSVNTPLGVCVTSGGLADNYYGWFWRGMGQEYVYVKSTVAAADTQMSTSATAGQVDDVAADFIHELYNVAVVSSAGLNLCRSTTLLCTNRATANT